MSNTSIPYWLDALPDQYDFYLEYGSSYEMKYIPWARRYRINRLSEAQNHKCCYCGDSMDWDNLIPTVEHVQRRCDGGADEMDNLVAACAPCNSSRQDADPVEWAQRGGKYYSPTPNARIFTT